MFVLPFLHLYIAVNIITVLIPQKFTIMSLVQQLQPAGMAVISADLAVWLVEAGWVGEGRRDGVGVSGGGGVPRRRGQGPGVALGDGEGRRAVVLIGNSGCSFPRSQGLTLRQLVSQLWHTFFFLGGQIVKMSQQSSPGKSLSSKTILG